MSETLSRREVVMRSVPALAMAGALSIAGPLLAASNAGAIIALDENAAVMDGQYVLPPLPYAYDALEPSIDAETMRLHHDKHHQAYVNNLNKAVKELAALPDPAPAPLLSGLQEDLSFNAGGHFLHTLFWVSMGPSTGGAPHGALADALARDFGSVEGFRGRFSGVAAGVKGSGWAILAYEPIADRLIMLQVKQHDLQLAPWAIPLLPLDVWEHAYYLKYHSARPEYVKAWWDVVNWHAVADAYSAARQQAGRT
jgi:Fe-Mn family superoxide dismutase